jgi:hypothetical protein
MFVPLMTPFLLHHLSLARIVTLKSEQAKYKILNSEISLKNRSVNFFEIDKNVTNVTIKDVEIRASDKWFNKKGCHL